MKHTIPTPRILESLFEFNFDALQKSSDKAMIWDGDGTENPIWFLSDSVLFYLSGGRRLSPDHNALSLDMMTIFDLHGYKPTLSEERDSGDRLVYQYPTEVNGNGLPIVAWLLHPAIGLNDFYPTRFSTNHIMFGWKDQSVDQNLYRKDGPDRFVTHSAKFDQNSLVWEVSDELLYPDFYDNYILNRVPFMNPFRRPFFEDPMDELEYLVETK